MGTYGIGIYDNDDALDFAFDLADSGDFGKLDDAISAVERIGARLP